MLTEYIITLLAESPGFHTAEILQAKIFDRWPALQGIARVEQIRQAVDSMESLGVDCSESRLSWKIQPEGVVTWMASRLHLDHGQNWWIEYGINDRQTLEFTTMHGSTTSPELAITLIDRVRWAITGIGKTHQAWDVQGGKAIVHTIDLPDAVTERIASHKIRRSDS